MAGRESDSPEWWAKILGMRSVPMFGRKRQSTHPGTHVLLDGEKGSFALFTSDVDRMRVESTPLEWSWSSNLPFSFIVDHARRLLVARRWSDPDWIGEYPLPNPNEALNIVESLSRSPQSDRTVINRMVKVFRSVRWNIEQRGGKDTDAILTFNSLLAWTDAIRQGVPFFSEPSPYSKLNDIVPLLSRENFIDFTLTDFSSNIQSFRISEFADSLIERDPDTQFYLNPDLLIRHAAGALFQEAHTELYRRPQTVIQLNLDLITLDDRPPRGTAGQSTYFTPPSLARVLVQEALDELRETNNLPDRISVLDPACGSGVFLIEALREITETTNASIELKGIDRSLVSRYMTEFCLKQAATDNGIRESAITVEMGDSLVMKSWGDPDIILMNPPFVSWEDMSTDDQGTVKSVLGELYRGRADASIAFVAKAILSLKPGSVLATIIPSSFLDSKAASHLRGSISDDQTLRVRLIGRFRGFQYVRGATVELAVLIISRGDTNHRSARDSVRILLAAKDRQDDAIRALRRNDQRTLADGPWELFDLPFADLAPASWMPKSLRAIQLIHSLVESGMTRVGDLFVVHQGIRTGSNPTFILSRAELKELVRTKGDLPRFFRPIADDIENGKIIPGKYVFYPYAANGELSIRDEQELSQFVPGFLEKRLLPNRSSLRKRGKIEGRQYWELTWPRQTWQPKRSSKFVTAAYGHRGNFAYDINGRYAVVQGFAWLWKKDRFHDSSLCWAYLAVLNSPIFELLIDQFCPRVQGGQFELSKKYVVNIFIPDLSSGGIDRSLVAHLDQIGRSMSEGGSPDKEELDAAVAAAYGLPLARMRWSLSHDESQAIERSFSEFADRWERETRFVSSSSDIHDNESYQKIISLGEPAIPMILSRLEDRNKHWFHALRAITGQNPVPDENRGNIKKMAELWLRWGKEHGYRG